MQWNNRIGNILISGEFFYQQDGIDAAKGEVLNGRYVHRLLQYFLHVLDHGAALVNFFQIQGRRDKTILHHIEGHDRFNSAAGGHGVASIAF